MVSDFEKLRLLYFKYDSLAASGEDVVSDLRKKINNIELSLLRDIILPKVAKFLLSETTELRCSVDCSLQSNGSKIEYSFCTDYSPVVKASISATEISQIEKSSEGTIINSDLLKNLSSSISRLTELTSEIDVCKNEALKYLSQIKEASCLSKEPITTSPFESNAPDEAVTEKILYCRSQSCNAKGRLLSNRDIIILKGSLLRTDTTPTYRPKEFRDNILSRYCSLTADGYITLMDLPAMSVSGASGLCLGRSSNGNVDWKDEHGICLADLS